MVLVLLLVFLVGSDFGFVSELTFGNSPEAQVQETAVFAKTENGLNRQNVNR